MNDPKTTPRTAEAGFTLIEVMISAVIFVVGCCAMVGGLVVSEGARQDCDSREVALEAVLSIADEIRATPIDQVVSDWGEEGVFGNTFPIPGVKKGLGRITIVHDETLTDDALGMKLDMPRDLDGDGEAKTEDVSTTAFMLPVIVEAAWGPKGRREKFRIPVVVLR